MTAKLTLEFPQSGKRYEILPEEAITAGRGLGEILNLSTLMGADISIEAVSRAHFRIFYEDGHFKIEDLSRYGTWLDNRRLYKNEPRILTSGQKITLADDDRLMILVNEERDQEETRAIDQFSPALRFVLNELNGWYDFVLLGVAGIGKTTTLRMLTASGKEELLEKLLLDYRSIAFCYINCMVFDTPTLASFFKLLIAATKPHFDEWPIELRESYERLGNSNASIDMITPAMLQVIDIFYQQLGKRVVFLLDQFDGLYPQLPSQLFALLTEIKTRTKPEILYGIAMQRPFDPEDGAISQFLRPIIHRFREYWLKPLDEADLQRLLKPYELDVSQNRLTIRIGGGHPRLTELIASYIKGAGQITSDKDAFLNKLLDDKLIASHCREIWDSLKRYEQEGLLSVVMNRPHMTPAVEKRLSNERYLLFRDNSDNLHFTNLLFEAYVQHITDGSSNSSEVAQSGLEYDEKKSEFIVDGNRIPAETLNQLQRNLLSYLYEHAGEVCQYGDISEKVWQYTGELAATNQQIARLVSELRKIFNQVSPGSGKRYIITVSKAGYKCVVA